MTRAFNSALYRGRLMHARRDEHARRAFRYPVYMACLDLDELDVLDRDLRLFSRGRRNVFAFHDCDYAATLSPSARERAPAANDEALAEHVTLRASLAALHEGAGYAVPHAIRVVTNLRTFGYVFNPVTFFLGYDAHGALATVVAEVNNTYGGRLRYLLGPRERLPNRGNGRVGFRHVRELFVSPFLHGEATYDFWFDAPLDGAALSIAMRVAQRDQTTFVARLEGARAPLSDRTLALAALRYPVMSAQVIGLIHWQALKLRLAGVPYRRPRADHRPLRDGGQTQLHKFPDNNM
jgi:DUF1365 family protein